MTDSLYRRSPMLQGDDVAEVQRRLSGLGFDPGGVDGIFGDNTHAAITDFQHNMDLVTDGICGPVTLSELKRVAPVRGGTDLVTPLRELLRVAATPATLSCKKIAVGRRAASPRVWRRFTARSCRRGTVIRVTRS